MDLDFNAQSFACEENKSQEDDLKTIQNCTNYSTEIDCKNTSKDLEIVQDAMQVTEGILQVGIHSGMPIVSIVQSALEFGCEFLSIDNSSSNVITLKQIININYGDPSVKKVLQEHFSELTSKADAIFKETMSIQKTLNDVKDITIELRYEDGVEDIEAFFKTIVNPKRRFQEVMDAISTERLMGLETTLHKHFNLEKLEKGLTLLKDRSIESCSAFFQRSLVSRAKYLLIMAMYHTHHKQPKCIENEFKDFTNFAREICEVFRRISEDVMQSKENLGINVEQVSF